MDIIIFLILLLNLIATLISLFKNNGESNITERIGRLETSVTKEISDFKFELKKKKNLSIIFKIYQKYNDINNGKWRKVYKLKFKNFSEFDDFVDNLTLLTKLKWGGCNNV